MTIIWHKNYALLRYASYNKTPFRKGIAPLPGGTAVNAYRTKQLCLRGTMMINPPGTYTPKIL